MEYLPIIDIARYKTACDDLRTIGEDIFWKILIHIKQTLSVHFEATKLPKIHGFI